MSLRKIKPITPKAPLMIDTVKLAPKCSIPGKVEYKKDIVGDAFADLITITTNPSIPLLEGIYNIEVVKVSDTDVTGQYSVYDVTRNVLTGPINVSASANTGVIPGIAIKIETTEGTEKGDMVQIKVIGDQTFIIPGTILGKVVSDNDPRKGLWIPATDSLLSSAIIGPVAVANSCQETDKSKTEIESSFTTPLSDVYTIEVIVYGQVYESVCREINLTDNLKALLPHICWV